jgi:hypothetical protein
MSQRRRRLEFLEIVYYNGGSAARLTSRGAFDENKRICRQTVLCVSEQHTIQARTMNTCE